MRGLFLAATIGLLTLAASAAPGGPPAQNTSAQNQGTERLNEETNARLRQQIEERERVLQRNRDTRERIRLENERAQREYQEQLRAREQEQQRYNAEMERFRAQQATRGAGNTSRTEAARETPPTRRVDANRARQSTASADTSCQDQRQRARRRGRGVGGVLGGVAGVLGGRNLGNAARIGLAVASVPIGALIGEAIASRLDCREQQQAAVATEQVTDQAAERGVGATVAWQSETRPNVTGTTTVTALSTPTAAAANACMTVTDVIIVDGEETRAEKRMCRRPPTNRFVRV